MDTVHATQNVSENPTDEGSDKNRLVLALKKSLAHFTLEVELSLWPGITILFGASGSGKTTLLQCIAGLVQPGSGSLVLGPRILFDSEKRINVPVVRRRIAYLFQDLALFPHLNVEQNVQYGLARTSLQDRRKRTLEILNSFRIEHLVNRKPHEVSGGERQRIALARSLVTDPSLLLLDEPLSALDSITKSKIIEDLRAWNAAHAIPILYVTHALTEAFALGERVVVLDRGRILAHGTPQQVLAAPRNETVAQLAGFENIFAAAVISRNEGHGTLRCRLDDSAVELEVPLARYASGTRVRVAIRAGDIMLASIRPEGLSARNVFQGDLLSVRRQGVTIIATVESGVRFQIDLTPSAFDQLRLKIGQSVWLVIKTYSCHLVA